MKSTVKLLILLPILTMHSCFFMPPGAAHGHTYKQVNNPNSNIKLSVICTQGNKTHLISGVEKNDSVNIFTNKSLKNKRFYYNQDFTQDSTRFFFLKVGDFNYHKKILDDTIKVNVIKENLKVYTYSFLLEE